MGYGMQVSNYKHGYALLVCACMGACTV